MKKARIRVWSMLLAVAMLLAMMPTVALAAGSETEENYVTLELTYGRNVNEGDQINANRNTRIRSMRIVQRQTKPTWRSMA